jgi:phosphatidylserine/phosphatidylglycerophosphate/cardiolipin synthase-like enzyme
LIAAGIPVLGDRHEALMHHKFAIIDHYEVWTGSMNLTLNGAYHNNNNLIWIRSTRLAKDYQTEFDEMFVDDLFGDASPANTPYPSLTIDNTRVDVFFSPDDGVQAQIVALINQAQESVYFLAFAFTADPIRDALIAAQGRGVVVGGVIETDQASGQGGDYESLLNAGINVRLDGNGKNMHHKVFIIDGQIVVTGSYNFSRSAEENNDENTLALYSTEIAALYLEEFDKVFANGR